MLNFKDVGHGDPVLLIHGLFGDLNNLGSLARALVEQGFRVIQIDTRNHGASPTLDGMDYLSQAADVKALLAQLKLASVKVVGHSMGGKIAMQLALQQPELIQCLVVADIAPVPYQSHHVQVIKGLRALQQTNTANRKEADALLAQFVDEVGVRQFLLKNLTWSDAKCQWRLRIEQVLAGYDDVIDWPKTDVSFDGPTLFVKGSESEYILESHRSAIGQHFPAAKARIIQGTGHWLHAQKPADFNRIVSAFLASN
ncbi:alpha/beta fold hydrolase [Neiella marina]|uniref:Alpha/beta fold hydrolase n=1 Tax=Neiella holothuriorum TaxID=2870530 RepID=A0ABS7EFV8_9GAMM|nr:alpha/beta fold hydrolase [Neiella holothuriorum]MBW8190676.1 alpha/beta fold hydrolase [Neiella holothuriorum]